MAAAGPLANLALAIVAFAVLKAGLAGGVWQPPMTIEEGQVIYHGQIDRLVMPVAGSAAWLEGLGRLCSILLSLNLVLFVFNIIPLPPMDGSAILAGLFAPARALRDRLRTSPIAGLLGLVVAWYAFGHIFRPIFGPVVDLLWS
jgi:Zn-dependent protease